MKWKERGHFHHLPYPSPLTPATQVTITSSKCYFHAENIQRLLSASLIRKCGHLSFATLSEWKPEVYLLHYVTTLNYRMMSRYVRVSYMTSYNKQRWQTGGCKIAVSYL